MCKRVTAAGYATCNGHCRRLRRRRRPTCGRCRARPALCPSSVGFAVLALQSMVESFWGARAASYDAWIGRRRRRRCRAARAAARALLHLPDSARPPTRQLARSHWSSISAGQRQAGPPAGPPAGGGSAAAARAALPHPLGQPCRLPPHQPTQINARFSHRRPPG